MTEHHHAARVEGPRAAEKTASGERYAAELKDMWRHWTGAWLDVVRSRSLVQDCFAGVTVAAVALPLNLALAVACGLPPIAGLVAGAVGGGLAAILGGTPLQVSGPAAALSVMVLAINKDMGPVGVAAAAMFVGVVQILLGFGLAGRIMSKLPEAVVAGFTTGVGIKLLDMQLPELLGFDYSVQHIVMMMHQPHWLHEVSWIAVVCGLAVAFLVVTTREYKRFPAALVGIAIVTALSTYLDWKIERVGTIPSRIPSPAFPLLLDDKWIDLVSAAFPLAILAAAESLISANAVDRMAAKDLRKHQPNLELVGQGIANTITGLFQGMPVTGVIVRSGANVQCGARTRLSSAIHSAMLFCAILYLSESIAKIPLAGLAGLLLVIGVRLVEVKTLLHLWRDERHAALAFVATCAGTVTGHLVLGLGAGLIIYFAGAYLNPHEEKAVERPREKGVRAILDRAKAAARHRTHAEMVSPERRQWLSHIREEPLAPRSSYVHDKATVIGKVVLGDHVHIAAESSVRADEGSPFFIGSSSNIQDGVVLHALKEKHVRVDGEDWAIYVGKNVSLAHGSLVHGPTYIGDNTFVGFKAIVHDSVVGANCFVGIGAIVVGVEIPEGRFVPHGSIVDTADKADALPAVSEAQNEFNHDVVEVNRGLAAAYRESVSPRPHARPMALEEAVLDMPGLSTADRF